MKSQNGGAIQRTIVAAVVLGMFLSTGVVGCGPPEEPSEAEVIQEALPTPTSVPPTPTPGSIYGEAPQLAEMVAAGELPPVEERLPTNPVVIQPVERVGVYGGTWRMGAAEEFKRSIISDYAGYENLLRWDPTWTRIIPNIAQSYDVSEDASEFTFHLREGLRWSDGASFTADDILFWYEAELLNEELYENIPGYLIVDGTPVVVERIDAYTVKFSFAGPYGQFPYELANRPTDDITDRPRHYFEEFHPDYNPAGIDELIEEAGFETWIELYRSKAGHRRSPDIPSMNAWVLTDWYDEENSTSVVMDRNPYYWKVDTEFNQLPYIDRIEFTIYPSKEDLYLAAMDGQIDMQNVGTRESNYADFAAEMTTGAYDLYTITNPRANYQAIELNLVHQDPVLRAVFSNKTFRIALSHAIDRTEVIDKVFGIDLEPRQPSPLGISPYYRERMETQFLEYDVAYANELLDTEGYDERDSEGYRLTPEGQRIEITISAQAGSPYNQATAELLSEYWGELGIRVNIEVREQWPQTQLVRANEHDAIIASIRGGMDVVEKPGIYMPYNEYDSYWAIPWVYWYEDNSLGEEPPAPVKEQMGLYDQIRSSTDPDEIERLMDQILAIAEEEFFVMGICTNENFYFVVKENFHNVPRIMSKSSFYPAHTNPSQYFIDPQE